MVPLMRHRSKVLDNDAQYYTDKMPGVCYPELTFQSESGNIKELVEIDDVVGNRKGDNPCLHSKVRVDPIRKLTLIRYGFDGQEACGSRKYATDEYRGVTYISPSQLRSIIPLELCPIPNPSRSDIWDQIANPNRLEFFETAVSLKEGAVAMAQSVSSKLNYLRTMPKPQFIPRNRKGLEKLRKGGIAGLASYLEWEFGWKQAGEDVAKLLAFTGGLRAHLRDLQDNQGRVVREGFSQTLSTAGSVNLGVSQIDYTSVSVARLAYKLKYEFTQVPPIPTKKLDKAIFTLSKSLDYFGLSISARRTWNIVPGSWLIDQVLPVADFLNDFGNSDGLVGSYQSVQYLGSQSSVKTTVTGTITSKETGWLYAGNPAYTQKFEISEYRRSGISFVPPPQFSIRNRPSGGGISDTGQAYLGLLGLNRLNFRKKIPSRLR